jgi:hypothetical protein
MADKMTLTAGGHEFTEKGGKCKSCGMTWAEYDKSRTTCEQRNQMSRCAALPVKNSYDQSVI